MTRIATTTPAGAGHKEYDYVDTYGPFASWQGCVEARPYPYNTTDAPASGGSNNTGIGFGDPATMFVPMFAPDEPGNRWKLTQDPDEPQPVTYGASNNWWNDDPSSSTGRSRAAEHGEVLHAAPDRCAGVCQGSRPELQLHDRADHAAYRRHACRRGLQRINAAIDRMAANGNTNVPEGMAWGWRTVSSGEPFTEGRPEGEKGNDKVVIVLTDGANTYSVPNNDPAGNKSTYAAYGYLQPGYNNTGIGRLLTGHQRRPVRLFEQQLYRCARRPHGDAVRPRKGGQHHGHNGLARAEHQQRQREQGDRGAEEMRVGFALQQGPSDPSKPGQAVLQRRRQQR